MAQMTTMTLRAPPLRLALARTLPLDWPWNFKWGTELECASGRCQCSLSVALGARRGPSPSSRLIPVGARYAPNDRHPSSSSTDVRRSQVNVQSPILACQCTVHFRFEVLLVSTQPGVSTAANNERHKGSLATVEGIVSSVHEKPKLSSHFQILGRPGAVPVNSPQGHTSGSSGTLHTRALPFDDSNQSRRPRRARAPASNP